MSAEPDSAADPFAWVDEPTDSESGNAQHNPDAWELRDRVTKLRTALAARDAQHSEDIAHVAANAIRLNKAAVEFLNGGTDA